MSGIETDCSAAYHRADTLCEKINNIGDVDFSTPKEILADTINVVRSIHKFAKRHGIRPPEQVIDELDDVAQENLAALVEAVDWSLSDANAINPKYARRAKRLDVYMSAEILGTEVY